VPDDQHDTREPTDPSERLRQLEEAAGFTSHDVDQLRDAVLAMERRLREMVERLGRLEARLDGLFDPDANTGEGDASDVEPPQPGAG
jgi:uncharacterized coiled-coil protein SlyX